MARFLSWEHLTQEQIHSLRAASKSMPGAPTARQLLRQQLEAEQQQTSSQALEAAADEQLLRREILLDLYSYALQQGQAWGFDDERLSVLFGLVKEVHIRSVLQRLTIEHSFAFFKDSLMNHSIHRPPFSCGVFSQAEMRAILEWMLQTYYKHYKLYQYAFTKRVTLSITTYHPSSLVEVPPACLAPLADAITEQQHQQQLDEEQRLLEEQQRRDAEAAAAAAEEEAARRVAEEYEASLPEDVKAKVALILEREVAYLKKKMEEQFAEQQAGLLAKLAQLEAAPAAAAGSSQHAAH